MTAAKARALYSAGITDAYLLAGADEQRVFRALSDGLPAAMTKIHGVAK